MKKIVLSLLLLAVFTVPAFSETRDMPMREHGKGHGRMMEMGNMDRMDDMMEICMAHAEQMGFTDEQLVKLKPLHIDMQKKHARFKADLKIAELELMEIMDARDFDLDKAGAAVKKIEGIKTANCLDMLKAMKEVRTVLTDDQFKQMKKMCF